MPLKRSIRNSNNTSINTNNNVSNSGSNNASNSTVDNENKDRKHKNNPYYTWY